MASAAGTGAGTGGRITVCRGSGRRAFTVEAVGAAEAPRTAVCPLIVVVAAAIVVEADPGVYEVGCTAILHGGTDDPRGAPRRSRWILPLRAPRRTCGPWRRRSPAAVGLALPEIGRRTTIIAHDRTHSGPQAPHDQ
ncbi:hypothetical protein [Streptomonospora salina]|uniref:hypothetical protein n=1 Tax=Streptomonospora salina TaxID=104205 RepID=UPI0016087A91|nr:hypothetical protein [Streptomonospora salina]